MLTDPRPWSAIRAAFSPEWSITGRLTRHFFISAAILLVSAATILHFGLRRGLEQQDEALVASKVRVLRQLVEEGHHQAGALRSEIEHEAGEESVLHYYLRVLEADGVAAAETPGMADAVPAGLFPPPPIADGATVTLRKTISGRGFLLGIARARSATDHGEDHVLQVALALDHDEALLAQYRRTVALVLIGGVILAAVVSAIITLRGLRPVLRIARVARETSPSRLRRVMLSDSRWPRELTGLAADFDRMLVRLDDSFRRLHQCTGDMAHALRNPIHNLRGEAEVMLGRERSPAEYQQCLASSLEELDRLSRMIDGLLFIARSDEAVTAIDRRHFPVRSELDAVVEFYEALAALRQVGISCHGGAELFADSMLVRRAVSNLLANALKHTPAGGSVRVAAERSSDGDVVITVTDTGCGIAPEHLPRVFERFFQVDKTRDQSTKGAGLGLAIVQSIMQLHGGRVEMQSELGKGTTVVLRFPAAHAT